MGVDVRPEVLVRRPRAEVAAFMFDPRNDLRWTGGITSSRPAQPGPLVEGAMVQRTARFLGRTFSYGYVVTEHQPEQWKYQLPWPRSVSRGHFWPRRRRVPGCRQPPRFTITPWVRMASSASKMVRWLHGPRCADRSVETDGGMKSIIGLSSRRRLLLRAGPQRAWRGG